MLFVYINNEQITQTNVPNQMGSNLNKACPIFSKGSEMNII